MADNLVIHEPPSLPYGGQRRGKDAMQRLYAHVMGYWDDPEVEWIDLLGGKSHSVALLHLTITPKHGGSRFSQHVVEVTTFNEAGKMADMRIHYFDAAEVARKAAGA